MNKHRFRPQSLFAYRLSRLRISEGDFPIDRVHIGAMCFDERIKSTLFLMYELEEFFPLAFNDFQMAKCLNLADEMYHLRHRQPNLVPFNV